MRMCLMVKTRLYLQPQKTLLIFFLAKRCGKFLRSCVECLIDSLSIYNKLAGKEAFAGLGSRSSRLNVKFVSSFNSGISHENC
jgi:hypothetical protein